MKSRKKTNYVRLNFLKEVKVQILEKNYSHFIAPVSSSQYSQKLAICPHPESNQSRPLFSTCFCKILFNIILPSISRCYTSSLVSEFPTKRPVTHACHMPNTTQHWTLLYTSKLQTRVLWASLPNTFKPSTWAYANKLVLWIPAYCNEDQIARGCHW